MQTLNLSINQANNMQFIWKSSIPLIKTKYREIDPRQEKPQTLEFKKGRMEILGWNAPTRELDVGQNDEFAKLLQSLRDLKKRLVLGTWDNRTEKIQRITDELSERREHQLNHVPEEEITRREYKEWISGLPCRTWGPACSSWKWASPKHPSQTQRGSSWNRRHISWRRGWYYHKLAISLVPLGCLQTMCPLWRQKRLPRNWSTPWFGDRD